MEIQTSVKPSKTLNLTISHYNIYRQWPVDLGGGVNFVFFCTNQEKKSDPGEVYILTSKMGFNADQMLLIMFSANIRIYTPDIVCKSSGGSADFKTVQL